MRTMLRTALAVIALSMLPAAGARAAPRWESYAQAPRLPPPALEGRVAHDGARIWFAAYGQGRPVILLHGALGNSENFGFQVPALVAAGHRVIVIDSRGQGRSTRDARPLSYELMESDVVAVMDALGVRKASFVGWSDGGIIALILAMRHPGRADRIFAFGVNMDLKGVVPDAFSNPLVGQVIAEAKADYARLSETPADFDGLLATVSTMVETQPNYTARDLGRIRGPRIAIADGDHEELIRPEHTRYLARSIPGAKLVLLKDVSHFAPAQDPEQFNRTALAFIDGR